MKVIIGSSCSLALGLDSSLQDGGVKYLIGIYNTFFTFIIRNWNLMTSNIVIEACNYRRRDIHRRGVIGLHINSQSFSNINYFSNKPVLKRNQYTVLIWVLISNS